MVSSQGIGMPISKGEVLNASGKSKISEDEYRALVAFFRDNPGATKKAAVECKVSYNTARRAWNDGWPKRKWDPISVVVAEEAIAARAAIHDAHIEKQRDQHAAELERGYEEAEKARQQVIVARRQEGEMVRGERANILALMGVTGRVLRGALAMAPKLEVQIRTGKDVDGKPLTVRDQIDLLWKIARSVKLGGEAAHQIVQTERLLLGEPTEILGVKRDLDGLTEEDAIRELLASGEMGHRMAKRRELRLRLLQGGKADTAPLEDDATGTDNED